MPKSNMKMYFQETNSPLKEKMIILHDHMMTTTMLITSIVMYWMLIFLLNKKINFKENESNETEMFWTSIPMIILMFMAIPSILILYSSEEMNKPSMNIKIKGMQWWWEYEIPSMKKNLKTEMFIKKSNINRLTNTNNNIIIPMNINTRLMISSNDVIHSWAIPAMFLKTDAIPGRINQTSIMINKPSMMKGQCSELCGMNHSFMPISLISKYIKKPKGISLLS